MSSRIRRAVHPEHPLQLQPKMSHAHVPGQYVAPGQDEVPRLLCSSHESGKIHAPALLPGGQQLKESHDEMSYEELGQDVYTDVQQMLGPLNVEQTSLHSQVPEIERVFPKRIKVIPKRDRFMMMLYVFG